MILSLLILIPLFFALLCGCLNGNAIKGVSIFGALIPCAIVMWICMNFDSYISDMQFSESYRWFGVMRYSLGIDGISLPMLILSNALIPVCLCFAYIIEIENVELFCAMILMIQSVMNGFFCSTDAFLFYIFFEAALIPMMVIMQMWGGVNKTYSMVKFLIYTIVGSVFFLSALLFLVWYAGTSNIHDMMVHCKDLSYSMKTLLWCLIMVAFAVKTPMWLFHSWLPNAHVEAPTAGSMILAGILLKMGPYGMLRFIIPGFHDVNTYMMTLMLSLSVAAIVIVSLVAFAQKDIKKLVAYSSIAHMGYVTLGIFSQTVIGVQSAIFQMMSHGIISAGLFLWIGIVYSKSKTRDMYKYGDMASYAPWYAFILMALTLGSIGLPGTSGFIGEFFSLSSVMFVSKGFAFVAVTGVIFGALYMMNMYRHICFGGSAKLTIQDASVRERGLFIVIIFAMLLIGVMPNLIMKLSFKSVTESIAFSSPVLR